MFCLRSQSSTSQTLAHVSSFGIRITSLHISRRYSYALYDVEDQETTTESKPLWRMSNPGLLFAASRVKNPKTSDEKYNRFYNDEHLPDVLTRKAITLALRYKNANQESKRPYLALYPLDDLSSLGSPEMVNLGEETKISRTLDGEDINDHMEFDARPYQKIQTFEGYGHAEKSGKERGQTIVCVAMEPAEGEDANFEDWYRKQHLDMLAMCRGYRRTTRYKRIDGVSPRFLALHEYACTPSELPADQVKQVASTEWSKKIVGEAKVFDRDVFELIQAQGDIASKL